MFVNTAVAAICAGTAIILTLQGKMQGNRWRALASRTLGIVVLALGGATLLQHVFGVNLGIDTLLHGPQSGNKAAVAPGRMGPPASVSFTLLGLALCFLSSDRRVRRAVPGLAIVVMAIAMLGIIGYLFHADPLFATARFTGIALQTATIILALGAALLLSVPDLEPARTLHQNTAAGLLARRALPLVIVLPMLLGWLFILGRKAQLFDRGMGTAMLALALITVLCGLLWWCVGDVAKHERMSHEQRARLQSLLAIMPAAVYTCDAEGRITFYNCRAAELWGRNPKLMDQNERFCACYKVFSGDGRLVPPHETPMAIALREGRPFRNIEATVERPDGSRFVAAVNIDPLYDERGEICGAINVFQDVTQLKCAEQELRQRADEFQTLIDTAPVGIGVATDPDCKHIWGNPVFAAMLGCESGANISKTGPAADLLPFRAFKNGIEIPSEDLPMQRACREGGPVTRDVIEIVRADGAQVTLLCSARPLFDESGGVRGCIGAFLDITEAQRAEAELRSSQEQLLVHSKVLESMAEGVVLTAEDGTILYTNPASDQMFGYAPGEQRGKPATSHNDLPPEENRQFVENIIASMKETGFWEGYFRNIRKDGTTFISHGRISKLELDGKPHWVCVQQDVTERKRVDDALRESERRLSTFIANLPGMVYRCPTEPPWPLTFVSEGVFQLTGWTPDDFAQGRIRWLDVMHEEDVAMVEREVASALQERRIFSVPYRIHSRSGEVRWALDRGQPIFDETGAPVAFEGIVSDLTDLKRAEQALRDSERRFRSLVNSVEGIVWECVVAPDGFSFTFVSDQAERLLGYPVEQWLTEKDFWQNHLHPEDRDWAINFCISATQENRDHEFEYRMIKADGAIVWLRDIVSVIAENGRPAKLVGVMVDVTKQREAQAALRQSEKQFRQLAETLPQIVWTATADGHVDYYNRRWFEYTGLQEAQTDGRWGLILHPDDRQRSFDAWNRCVQTGESFEIEYRFSDRVTGGYRWFLGRALPIRDESGSVIRWFGTCTDIDDRKRVEEKLEQMVNERTASLREANGQLEQFSYTVSHDLRAPLRAIEGYARVLNEDYRSFLPGDGQTLLDRISRNTAHMDRLINDVLTLSRIAQSEIRLHAVKLQPLIEEIIERFPMMQSPMARVELGELGAVLGDHVSLTQAISNLLSNAVKFVAPGVTPHVKVWSERRGDLVRLWVKDNGIGIKPEFQGKLFGMFQRLRPKDGYDGTGIGLAIVRKAVERLGGRVGIESDGHNGSGFWIELQGHFADEPSEHHPAG